MNTDELDQILRHTLSDLKLSRGEKRILSSTFEQLSNNDPHRLAVIRNRAFEIAREEVVGPDALAVIEWLEDVTKLLVLKPDAPEIESDAVFSPRDDAVGRITGMISRARNQIDICVFTITDDRITDRLCDAHQRRVKIRVITDDEKALDAGSDISRLKRHGIKVRTDQTRDHMHHKYAIFDDVRLLTGSYNWTRSASLYNEENFVITDDRRLIHQFEQHFEQLWKNFEHA